MKSVPNIPRNVEVTVSKTDVINVICDGFVVTGVLEDVVVEDGKLVLKITKITRD